MISAVGNRTFKIVKNGEDRTKIVILTEIVSAQTVVLDEMATQKLMKETNIDTVQVVIIGMEMPKTEIKIRKV
jgi:protoporphyrinogen oxidase